MTMNYFDQATVDEFNRLADLPAEAAETRDPRPPVPEASPLEAHHLGTHHG